MPSSEQRVGRVNRMCAVSRPSRRCRCLSLTRHQARHRALESRYIQPDSSEKESRLRVLRMADPPDRQTRSRTGAPQEAPRPTPSACVELRAWPAELVTGRNRETEPLWGSTGDLNYRELSS